METDELPSIDPNVDYRKILPIHQKRTIAFINHFIMNTVSFLNQFAQSCESRLMQFEYKLQKVEASLLILESQLASISDLNDLDVPVVTNVCEEQKNEEAEKESQINETGEQDEVENVEETKQNCNQGAPVASKDPRFAKFFKMVQVGVPAAGVKLKMQSLGLDPNILDTPNEVIPGYEINEQGSTDSSSDSD